MDNDADTILYNGKIITIDSSFSIREAVALKDGRILAVGKDAEILRHAGKATQLMDLDGKTVIPGIIDAHTHPITAAMSEYNNPIPDIRTIGNLLSWIKAEALKKDTGDWIVHPKFFASRMLEMRHPSIFELDSVSPENPVFLDGSYGAIVNSKALQISGIGYKTNHPGIIKDSKTGLPTGLIRKSAFELFHLPVQRALSEKEQLYMMKKMFELYNSVGITSICSGDGTRKDLRLYEKMRKKRILTVRVFQNLYPPFEKGDSLENMIGTLKNLEIRTGLGDEWIKVGGLKIILDGGILTGTAYLRKPWGERAGDLYGFNDPEYRGILNFTHDELLKVIMAAASTGWKFTAHVTGGGGVDTILAALKKVNMNIAIRNKRFSIIHGNFFTPYALQKMAEMGIYADMQPAWFFKDSDLIFSVLGKERIKYFHPYRSLFDFRIMVNGGSDHMVKLNPDTSINPYNPFVAMWSIITRKTERGSVHMPNEAITREEALKMYTINNAYASFDENIKGSIETGKLADLVVLSHDLLSCPVDSIRQIKVLMTMVGGQIVYRKNSQ